MVVVRHGGVVEDGGLAGLASGKEADGFGIFVLEFGSCKERSALELAL